MVIVGIPFAIATCVLIGIAALIFFGLCLLVVFFAGAFVFYTLKGIYIGIIVFVKFLKDPQAQIQTLPTTSQKKFQLNLTPAIGTEELWTSRFRYI